MDGYTYDPMGFQEIMQAGKDAARSGLERAAYLGYRIVRKRPPPLSLSTAEVAALWGVSENQVKLVLARGGVKGARRSSQGKGRPWVIPARKVHGETVVEAKRGKRGRNADYFVNDGKVAI